MVVAATLVPVTDAPVTDRPVLVDLASRLGVATDYWDWQGQHRTVSAATVVAVLRAFGLEAGSDDEAAAAWRDLDERPWRRTLPPVVVGTAGREVDVLVHVPHGSPVSVDVLTEDGDAVPARQVEHHVEPREIDGALVGEARFVLPGDLPLGYHTVRAAPPDGESATALLVVAPERLELPDLPRQVWGVMAQLYSVRSRASWGLGDFADLAALCQWAAEAGADFVLVNPLHAAEPVPPQEDSPYLPTTRRFLNPIYVRVEEVPEYVGLDAAGRQTVADLAARLSAGNEEAELLERDAVLAAKLTALELVHAVPRSQEREAAWTAFREREGAGLREYATWCALAEHFGEEFPEQAGPGSALVASLTDELADRIDFFAWLQWLADEQLEAAHATAIADGMRIGVITDLAVGVHPEGAEVWTLGDALATGVSVGAPPDPFNQLGQDWSQPPWRPDRLAELGYAPYRAMLRTVLRHAGALRIDHVMGLFRLWCIPEGRPAADGTYLRYDHEAMVSILLLEAHRAGAIVVGEDLGVVEPFVRDYLAARGVLGTSILWFERDGDAPRPPEHWRELCLATVTTHDLPPTAGYLLEEHVTLREQLGLLTRSVEEERGAAAHERWLFLSMLRDRGLVGDDPPIDDVVEAMHVLLTHSPSRLLGVSLADLAGDRRTQNQPGTHREYPNWRIPLTDAEGEAVLIEDLASHEFANRLAARLGRRDP